MRDFVVMAETGKNEHLLGDQVRKLYDHTYFGLIAALTNSCVLVLVLWGWVERSRLLGWLVTVLLVTLGRLLLSVRFYRASHAGDDTRKWKSRFYWSIFVAGLLWGATAIFLFPEMSTGRQVFIAFCTGGMVAGAVGSYTAILTPFFLFSVPTLLPVICRFVLTGGDIHLAMGGMLLIFFLVMSLTALRTHKDYFHLLALRYEKRELVDDLQQEVLHRKQVEHQLRKQNQRIEEIVNTRTIELKQAIEKLSDEVQAREEIALALKKSKQRLKAIINHAPVIIWAMDREGVFTFSEGRGLEKAGLQSGQVVGESVFEVFPDNVELQEYSRKVLSGEVVSGPVFYNGLVYANCCEPIVGDDGRIDGAIGVAIDVTSQYQAQEEVRKSQEKYRDLVENINDILFTVDQEGTITYMSPVVETVLGYQTGELVDTKISDLVDFGDRARLLLDFEEASSYEKKVGEYRFRSRTDKLKWCRISIRPIVDESKGRGVQGILADISQSKLLEEQLQRAHKMEALGSLAGGVAHDLNNILSGIVSYPDLLLLDLPEDSPLRKPLTTIKTSGEKAATIVQDLLTLARRGVAATEPLNVNDIVEEYLSSPEMKASLTLSPCIIIRQELQPDLMNIVGSRVHLAKSLMNLINNAIEAMPAGGTVTVSTANRYADKPIPGFDTVREGEYVVLTVRDTGIGIEEKDRARIFEPFYTKKVMGRSGSGLGMAVVWGTVKDHNGHINIESVAGEGSCIELFFPASRQLSAQSVQPVTHDEYTGNGELILVVDDVEQQREIATGMLRRLGYRAEAVPGGEEALNYLETSEQPDLIVLDMIMEPGIDGYETYKQIVDRNPRQKAIIVSGYSETQQVRKTQELGAGTYLKKPYGLTDIGLAVKKELGR